MQSDLQTYLTARQLQARFSCTEMTIWRWLKSEKLNFPEPLRVNNRRFWLKSEIERWERNLARERINAA